MRRAATVADMQRELVRAGDRGDQDAFSSLVDASIDRLYAVATLILRDSDRAQDAVQDALVSAWRGRARAAGSRRVGCVAPPPDRVGLLPGRQKERRRNLVELHVDARPGAGATFDVAAAFADRDLVERLLGDLPIDQRAVIVLHFYLDLPLEEVAHILESPSGPPSPGSTVASRRCAPRWPPNREPPPARTGGPA